MRVREAIFCASSYIYQPLMETSERILKACFSHSASKKKIGALEDF